MSAVTWRSAARDLRRAGRVLASAGLSPGSTGNISLRVGGRIMVTPSGVMLGELRGVAEIDADGRTVSRLRPTKEAPVHAAVYAHSERWCAAIHLHSTLATLLSTLSDLDESDAIPAMTPYLTMKAGLVRVIPYEPPGSPELGRHVAAVVTAGAQACLMRNHGSLVLGTNLEDALTLAFELEESAKLAVLSRGMPVRVLDADQRRELMESRPA